VPLPYNKDPVPEAKEFLGLSLAHLTTPRAQLRA
jgi:hypothetical protein